MQSLPQERFEKLSFVTKIMIIMLEFITCKALPCNDLPFELFLRLLRIKLERIRTYLRYVKTRNHIAALFTKDSASKRLYTAVGIPSCNDA